MKFILEEDEVTPSERFSLSSSTFHDMEYCIQIHYHGGDTVMTVSGDSTGPEEPVQFLVWDGAVLLEDALDADPIDTITIAQYPSIDMAWREAVRSAWIRAVTKMLAVEAV